MGLVHDPVEVDVVVALREQGLALDLPPAVIPARQTGTAFLVQQPAPGERLRIVAEEVASLVVKDPRPG